MSSAGSPTTRSPGSTSCCPGVTLRPQRNSGHRGCARRGQPDALIESLAGRVRSSGVALVLPEVSTAAMGLLLAELGRTLPIGTHAVLVLDRAGWHVGAELRVPDNVALVHLPPYSPELNLVENVWLYLRERWLSHRVLAGGYEAVVDAACRAWNALRAEPGRLG